MAKVSIEDLMGKAGEVLWDCGHEFLIKVGREYYIYSHPEYYKGSGALMPFDGDEEDFLRSRQFTFTRMGKMNLSDLIVPKEAA